MGDAQREDADLLTVENLAVSYGPFKVLHDISLSVRRGEVAILVGANGAGKSTVLKAISGFVAPGRGDVRLLGESIAGLMPHEILGRGCAYVAQGQDLFPSMTVAENVEMGGYLIQDRAARLTLRAEYLGLFPALEAKADVPAKGLSGGERQQLKLARALMTQPKLLLLDEPSAGLSPRLVDLIFEDLTRLLRHSGVGALVVEQNIKKALAIADTVHVLALGVVSKSGTPSAIGGMAGIRRIYLGGHSA